MATKSSLIGTVNGFITSLVTVAKHRNSMLEVINELYPSKVSDDSTSETYTTQTNANITYGIQIVKQGRSIRINGSYTNNSVSSLPIATTIFTFKDSQFKGDTSSYLGINAKHIPFLLQTTEITAASASIEFSIIFSANN